MSETEAREYCLTGPPQPFEAEGRWCQAEVLQERRLAALEPPFLGPCGGELHHARRCEGTKIVTYLSCLFCGSKTPVLSYDRETGELVDLLKETP